MLSDSAQRKEYDAVRAMAGGRARFTAGSGPAGGFSDDVFSGFFSRQSGRTPGAGYGGSSSINIEDLLGGMFAGAAGPAVSPRPRAPAATSRPPPR